MRGEQRGESGGRLRTGLGVAAGRRLRAAVVAAASLVALAGLVVAGSPAGAESANSAPGVTASSINVGAISTLTGSIASDFNGLVPGVKAYFDMVNAAGGIDGRKLNLRWNLDDGGSQSEFTALAHTLVDQDHAFAVVGVSTYWFSPGFFVRSGIPTYGYNVSGNWGGPSNLFAAGGSVQCYPCIVPGWSYLAKRSKAKSVAFLAYNVSSSRDACQTGASGFRKAGIKVSYTDFSVPIDGNITPDIQRMQRANVDFVVSCMDVNENISMARAIKQYGLKVHQLWLNGSDQSVLNHYSNLMQGVYFLLQNVPLSAPTAHYPGLAAYLAAMKKYEPQYLGDALAVQGWESAALFAAGVKAAGNDLTQQRVIQLTNQMANFTADGMSTVTDWTKGHNKNTFPNCTAYTKVEGKRAVPTLAKGHQVFVCFGRSLSDPKPVPAPAGTPGT